VNSIIRRVGAAVDTLWSAFDQDEPLFCECTNHRFCTDCALAGSLDSEPTWGVAPSGSPNVAA
jgi:hypothetical protein